MTVLRDYQRAAIDDTFARWSAGATRVPIVMATGLGKTRTFCGLISEWLDANPGKRALIIAHTNELIEQGAAAARAVMPGRRVGIVQGPRNNTTADVVMSSRQTLASAKRRNQLRNVGLIVIDECHHAHDANTYGAILRHFGALDCDVTPRDPAVKVLGVTATLARSDKKKLSTVWEDCTFTRDILFGIRHGYLLDVTGARVVVDELDMRNVAVRGGDFSESALGEELERSFAVERIAEKYVEVAKDRKGIAFWPLVATAQHAADVFNEAGIPSAVVHGAMDKAERRRVIADLRSGAIQVVHNAMVLTEGFDDPTVECVVIGRPTKSAPLYQQMVGRALRPDLTLPVSERRPALIIDVTGASEGNDLRSLIDLSPERRLDDAYEADPDASLGELSDIAEEIEAELAEQRAGATWDFESDDYDGAVTTQAFDPLARDKAWSLTDGGHWFVRSSRIAKGDSFVFLLPSLSGPEGTWDVAGCSRNIGYDPMRDAAPEWATGTAWVGLTLEQAMLHSEGIAGDAYNTRRNSWTNRPPGKHLKIAAWRAGVEVGSRTHGELQEAVDQAVASARIDPLVARVRSGMQQSDGQESSDRESAAS